jgi:hypothetical protein
VFTARYALSPYIKQIRFVFKWLMQVAHGLWHTSTRGTPVSGRLSLCLQLCELLRQHVEDKLLLHTTVFTDEARLTNAVMFEVRSSHIRAQNNPHYIQESGHQVCFCLSGWTGTVAGTVRRSYLLLVSLTVQRQRDFLQSVLSGLLKDVPTAARQRSSTLCLAAAECDIFTRMDLTWMVACMALSVTGSQSEGVSMWRHVKDTFRQFLPRLCNSSQRDFQAALTTIGANVFTAC